MIPLSYADQVLEGSFEYALNEIVEEHLDLSVFEHRYHNDATGRLAYDPKLFTVKDFVYDEANARCICPAGHKLYCSGKNMLFSGYRVASFKAPKTACRGCHLRERCLRHPEPTPQRQLAIIKHPEGPPGTERTSSKSRRNCPCRPLPTSLAP